MTRPTMSVVVPTRDRGAWLREAVDSVLEDGGAAVEVIVVDDAGNEPVELPADNRVLVVRRRENGGPAAARNTGLEAARGELIAFCDDDDRWAPGRTEAGVLGTKTAPIGLCRVADLNTGVAVARLLDGDVRASIADATTPHLGAATIRRLAMLPFDERFLACEDVDWWIRMTAKHLVQGIDRVGYLQRTHAGARVLHGDRARLEGSLLLLDVHAAWFANQRRAAAFRWKRIGVLAGRLGEPSLARRALLRSLRLQPHRGTAARLVLASWPLRSG